MLPVRPFNSVPGPPAARLPACRLSIKRDRMHVLFGGTKLLQSTGDKGAKIKTPDGGCLAVVLRTGFGTAQGERGGTGGCALAAWWRGRCLGTFCVEPGPGPAASRSEARIPCIQASPPCPHPACAPCLRTTRPCPPTRTAPLRPWPCNPSPLAPPLARCAPRGPTCLHI